MNNKHAASFVLFLLIGAMGYGTLVMKRKLNEMQEEESAESALCCVYRRHILLAGKRIYSRVEIFPGFLVPFNRNEREFTQVNPKVGVQIEPLDGVKTVNVEITWDPPWGMDMMSDEARLELGFM